MKNIVCFDTETTGVDIQKDKIIQIAMVKFDSENFQTVDSFQKYTIPEGDFVIPPEATEVHHLTKEFILQNGVPLKMWLSRLSTFSTVATFSRITATISTWLFSKTTSPRWALNGLCPTASITTR